MRVEIKIHGADEVRRTLESLPEAVRDNVLHQTLMDAAKPLAADAAARAPVKTGKLRASITIGRQAKDAKARKGAAVFVGSTSSLAHFQEYGTAHHAAQPFMRPAFDTTAGTTRRTIEEQILEHLARAVRRTRPSTQF